MIISVLFGFVFLGLVGGEIARLQFPHAVAFTLLDVAVAALVLSFYLKKAFTRTWGIPRRLTLAVFVFVGVAVLSLCFALFRYSLLHIGIALLYFVRWVLYVSLIFVAYEWSRTHNKLLSFFFLLSGSLLVCIGYLQYLLYPALRNLYYLGWDEHLGRLFSTFFDPNFMGAFLVLFLLFLFFKIREKNMKVHLRSALLATGLLATFGALLLTFSRSALLMLGMTVVTYLLLVGKKRHIVTVGIVSLLIIVILLPFMNSENTNLFRIASSEARLSSAGNAVSIFLRNPLIGVGFNTYRYAQVEYGYAPSVSPFPSHAGAGTDNSFLFVLATTGVMGFIAFGYFLYSLLAHSYAVYTQKKSLVSLLFFVSFGGILFDSLFNNSLFYPPIMAWVFILGGIMSRE